MTQRTQFRTFQPYQIGIVAVLFVLSAFASPPVRFGAYTIGKGLPKDMTRRPYAEYSTIADTIGYNSMYIYSELNESNVVYRLQIDFCHAKDETEARRIVGEIRDRIEAEHAIKFNAGPMHGDQEIWYWYNDGTMRLQLGAHPYRYNESVLEIRIDACNLSIVPMLYRTTESNAKPLQINNPRRTSTE